MEKTSGGAETEKITVNLSPVDLGKIDLLVANGLFSTRSDFLRNAVRRSLEDEDAIIKEVAVRDAYSWGLMHYSKKALERRRAKGERIRHRVIGYVRIDKDVSPELVDAVFEELVVMGVLKAPQAVLTALGDRVRRGVSLRGAAAGD
jgi:Arc/MetJ-type ribon-helix-helix transcriptional regulator